ncbi:hypothetical protein Tco_0587453 [Tanacetum coccineum]
MKPNIENMTLNEYLKYEAERLWDNVRSKRSPTNYAEADVDSFHRNKNIVQDSSWEQDNDLEEDQEDDGDDRDTFDMWDITVEDILNVAMVDEEADPTRDLEEPERLLVEDTYFTETQVFKEHIREVYKYQVRFLVEQSGDLWLLEVSAKKGRREVLCVCFANGVAPPWLHVLHNELP